MVFPLARGLACAVAVATVGCEPAAPTPRLTSIAPARAYTDRPQRVILRGASFVPALQLDLDGRSRIADAAGFRGWVGAGTAAMPGAALRDFGWRSEGELSATLDPGLGAGEHPVVLVDPRGNVAQLEGGFESLGLDRAAPTMTVLRPAPGTPLGPGGPLQVSLEVTDEGDVGEIAWQVTGTRGRVAAGICRVPASHTRVTCDFELAIPPDFLPGQLLELRVVASDAAQPANSVTFQRAFVLGDAPSITEVAPGRGGAGGGTEVVVRGLRFLPGSRVYFGRSLLVPDGGIHIDERTITGRTPAHPVGPAEIRVVTSIGDGTAASGFQYLAAPVLIAVEPAQGPRIGGTPMKILGANFTPQTRIFIGQTLRAAVPMPQAQVVSATEIAGSSPAAPSPTDGTATVFAVEAEIGVGSLKDGFSWMAP